MENTINHPNLGLCKVLLETELKNGKCFKFIQSWKYKRQKDVWIKERFCQGEWKTKTEWIDSRDQLRRGKFAKPHYYVLWGNSNNCEDMGLAKLTTNSGKNVRTFSSASKKFFELVKASEKMTFRK